MRNKIENLFRRIYFGLFVFTYAYWAFIQEHSFKLNNINSAGHFFDLLLHQLYHFSLAITGINIFYSLFGQNIYYILLFFAVGIFRKEVRSKQFLLGFLFFCLFTTYYDQHIIIGFIGHYLKSFPQNISGIVTSYYPSSLTYLIYTQQTIYFLASTILLIKAWQLNIKFIKREKSEKKKVKAVVKPVKATRAKNILPPLSLLQKYKKTTNNSWDNGKRTQQLAKVLKEFGVKGKIVRSNVGPVVTLYELQPEPGVKAIRIISLADDIARSMSALSARISTIPGKDVIGIELSNPERETVYLSDILNSEAYHNASGLPLALGSDISGKPTVVPLNKMPHMLVAGTTGSGKSVSIHAIVLSILFKHTPESCRIMMIDPKMLELSIYQGIPHLLTPVVTDPKMALISLKWAVQEMEKRYKILSEAGVRNLDEYNAKIDKQNEKKEERDKKDKIPYLVVVVDEFADLMLVSGKEIDVAIQRLAQMARAAGIHVILATQRPSVDVITGTIKANFPTRISFQLASKIDSRTILGDQSGAEQLLGKGDMLYLYMGKVHRAHGPFVSTQEVELVVNYWKDIQEPKYENISIEEDEMFGLDGDDNDEMFASVMKFVMTTKKASASSVQREFRIGFNKAARYMDMLEKMGKVSAPDSMGRRKVL